MSARLGNPLQPSGIAPVAAVTPNGRVLTFPTAAVALASIFAVWTASATVGNRTIQILIKDAAGNILLRLPAFTAVTAAQSVNLIALNASSFQNFAGPPLAQTMPLPADMPLPPGSTVTVVDTSNVDPTDTCSIAVSASF